MTETTFCDSNLLTQVSSICFDDVGYLYAGNFGPSPPTGNIIKIDNTGTGTLFASLNIYINNIVYYNNYLYVSTHSNNIYKVSIFDGTFVIFSTLPQLVSPLELIVMGLCYHNNYLYANATNASSEPVNIYKIDITNGANYTIFIDASYFTKPMYITFDSNNNFYVTDQGVNNVLKFDENGVLITSIFIQNAPFHTILFYNNQFYFTNYTVNQISQYDINGSLITDNYAFGGLTYIGGGIAFDNAGNFYVSNETNGGGAGNVTIQRILNSPLPPIPCFKEGSKILTDKGYIPIQDLRKGDLVKTLKNEYVPINMIGQRKMEHNAVEERIKDQLYNCSSDKYSEVFEDLIITGSHSILVDNLTQQQGEQTHKLLGKIYLTDDKLRLPACLDERSSVYDNKGTYTIYHIALDNNNYYMNYGIWANGLLVETCSKRYLKELSDMTLIE